MCRLVAQNTAARSNGTVLEGKVPERTSTMKGQADCDILFDYRNYLYFIRSSALQSPSSRSLSLITSRRKRENGGNPHSRAVVLLAEEPVSLSWLVSASESRDDCSGVVSKCQRPYFHVNNRDPTRQMTQLLLPVTEQLVSVQVTLQTLLLSKI